MQQALTPKAILRRNRTAVSIPQSALLTAYGPGRKHSLLPTLAKNMPLAYFLNAWRPLHKGALDAPAPVHSTTNPTHDTFMGRINCFRDTQL